MGQIQSTVCFYTGTWIHPLCCLSSLGVFTLQCWLWVVTKENLQTATPEVFIIWPFIEKVCRPLIIQLYIPKGSAAQSEKMTYPRAPKHVGQRQGHTCPCSLHCSVPRFSWWGWDIRCCSTFEGGLSLHLAVRFSSTPGHGDPDRRVRNREKAHREGWSPPWGWEGGGNNPPTILLCFILFQKYFHWVTV